MPVAKIGRFYKKPHHTENETTENSKNPERERENEKNEINKRNVFPLTHGEYVYSVYMLNAYIKYVCLLLFVYIHIFPFSFRFYFIIFSFSLIPQSKSFHYFLLL